MPILIVSGNCEAGVAEVSHLLARAGVTDARPSLRDNLSPVDLSATLIGTQAKPPRQSAPISLEALTRWRSHACEIVAANEQVNCWGWADQNLLSALEFWHEVIPGAKFVLVYSSPEYALANLKNAPENLDIWLSEWISRSEEMVRVACKFPESVTLVGAAGAIRHPVGLLEALGIAPEHPSGQATETSFLAGPSALSLLLAQLCLGRTREIKSLVAELESLASITAGGEPLVADRPKAWAEYRNLVENARHVVRQKAELAALTQRRDEQSQLASERANQIAALTKTRDEQTTQLSALTKASEEQARRIAELLTQQGEQSQISATLSAQVESLKSEGDQLLFQLHQTQEELEDFFLKFKASEASSSPRLSVVDFRSEVNGSNWFHPEVDGRWAGPALESTVLIPALPSGQYELMLDVVDTIAPHVLEQMEIWMNDTSLPLEHYGDGRAAVVKTQFRAAYSAAGDIWKIRLKFPVAMSPADEGSDDQRYLTIRARSLVVLGLD